jgi:putative transposase
MAVIHSMHQTRRSIRHPGHDYASAGAYFITICVANRQAQFGQIQNQQMMLNGIGQLAHTCWAEIPHHHPHSALDEFVIMPNHMHGILWITTSGATANGGRRTFGGSTKGSISTVIAGYKAAVTRTAHQTGLLAAARLWQARFWDRIIRNDIELAHIRDYIRNNPARWSDDQLHPNALPNPFNRPWDTTP